MRDLALLARLELRARYGWGRRRHLKDPRARRRETLLTVSWAVIAAVLEGYVAGYAYLLCSVGQSAVLPAFLAAIASVLIVAVGLFRAGEAVFGARGYELLAAMPLRPWALPLARLWVLYLEDTVLTLAVLLPGLGVYAATVRPGWSFYAIAVAGMLLLPAVPTGVAVLLGTAVTAVTARLKHKSVVGSLLTVGLVLAAVLGTTVLMPLGMIGSPEELTPERIGTLIATVGEALEEIDPPARWFGQAVAGGIGALGWLAGLAAAVALGTVLAVGAVFHPLVRRLGTTRATHRCRLTAAEQKRLTLSLYTRECRRYFASTVYVSNTILGPILGTVMSVVLLLVGTEPLQNALPAMPDLRALSPVALSAVFCLMTTTAVSLSMEGRQIDLIRSMPIPKKALLDAKLLWNLTLMLPAWAVSAVCLTVALRPTVGEAVWIWLYPLILLLFSAVIGLTVDLRFHRFDHDSETAAVKQSLSAMLGGFAGPLVALATAGALIAVPAGLIPFVQVGIGLGLAVLTVLLYRHNNRGELASLV